MTNAELAVLGLVVEKPRHGYEIEQVIEERSMRNWTEIGFSSIYYLLKKLEGEDLVGTRASAGRTKGPTRKVFGATRKGRTAWRRESLNALAMPQRQYPQILLGMAGIPRLDPIEVAAAFAEHRRGLQDRLDQITISREKSGPQLPDHVEAMFSYSEATIEAEQAWITAYLEAMESATKEH